MRLWSLHPKYLDPQGLVALWREALLARAVLTGKTRGYRHHPQLIRFREHPARLTAINIYLEGILSEAAMRGYAFDRSKMGPIRTHLIMTVTSGQLEYEWHHLMKKLALRSPQLHERCRAIRHPELHPLFRLCPGGIADWERWCGPSPRSRKPLPTRTRGPSSRRCRFNPGRTPPR